MKHRPIPITNNGKYTGRPSYASRARRNGELIKQSNASILNWINSTVSTLNPDEHITIPAKLAQSILVTTVRANIYRLNRQHNLNLKLHIDDVGNWWIWHCPDRSLKLNRSGSPISPTGTQSPSTASKPKRSTSIPPGSIYAPLEDVLAFLGTNEHSFNALPFSEQMRQRIKAGIALRDERRKREKLSLIFNAPK